MDYLLNFTDVLDYVDEKECAERDLFRNRRKFVEGQEVVNCNHIMYCGICRISDQKIEIMSLCLQSSCLYGPPHEIDLSIIYMSDNSKKLNCYCSCKAGLGERCKHCIGLLIFLTRTKQDELDTATCTDMKQKWGKIKDDARKMYEAAPMETFCHIKKVQPHYKVPNVPEYIKDRFLNTIFQRLPLGELGKTNLCFRSVPSDEDIPMKISFISKEDCKHILQSNICAPINENTTLFFGPNREKFVFGQLPVEMKNFYFQNVQVTLDEAVNICCHPDKQRSSFWMQQRSKRITASNAYSLITCFGKNVNWNKKIQSYFNKKFKGSDATVYGCEQEPFARECYERTENVNVIETGLLINPKIPWLGCSPDGIVLGKKYIEIKCPVQGKTKGAKEMIKNLDYLDFSSGVPKLKTKHAYHCQVQIGMFISNYHECDLILYSSSDKTCVVIKVPYEENLILNEYIPKLQYIFFLEILKYLVLVDNEKENQPIENNQS